METVKNFKLKTLYYVAIILFFLGLGILGPVGIYDDTPTYQALSSDRDPFYGIFLWLFSFLRTFGDDFYFRVIVLIQNGLMAYAGIRLLRFLEKKYNLNGVWSLLITGCLIAPHLLIPVATTSGMILCNSILSEGICIPVYLLFFTGLLKAVFASESIKETVKHGLISFVLALVLCMSRGQLQAVLIAWFIVMGFLCFVRKKKKWLIGVALLFVAGFFMKSTVNGLYNLGANGVYTGNTSESATMLAHAFFNADLEKEVAFENPDLQAVYEEIRELLVEYELNQAYAPKGLIDFVLYYEDCHDEIKFNHMVVPIHMHARNNGAKPGVETSIRCNEISKELCNKLYLQNPGALITTYVKLALAGLVRTVAYLHPVFILFSVLIFSFAALLVIRQFVRTKRGKSRECSAAVVMTLTLLLIAGLVFSTSFVTACISRYVIYNMSIFYIAFIVLFKESVWASFVEKNAVKC